MLSEIELKHEGPFLAMIEDYRKSDPDSLQFLFSADSKNSESKNLDWTQVRFRQFLKEAESAKLDWRPKAGKVSITRYLWLGEDGSIQANALLRFPLDGKSEIDGGNLFVSVPPSRRGKGFGSYCLALLLFEAVRAGLRRVLVTCPAVDESAKRMIEKNRGVFLDEVDSTHHLRSGTKIARFWISFS